MKIVSSSGKIYQQDKLSDPYFRMFLSNNALRESCYQCPSRGLKRRADITLSDFWGVKDCAKDLIDGQGLSLVVIHTEKGKQAFDEIQNRICGHEVDFSNAINGNPSFYNSYKKTELRDEICNDVDNMDIMQLEKKYYHENHAFVKSILRKLHLLDLIRKVLGKTE